MKRILLLFFAIAIAIVSTIASANAGQACQMGDADPSMDAHCEESTFVASGTMSCSENAASASKNISECSMPSCSSLCCAGIIFQYSMPTSQAIDSIAFLSPVAGDLLHSSSSTAFLSFHPEGPYHPPTA